MIPPAQVLYGIKAMEKLFGDMEKRIKETPEASIDLGDLKVFDTFAFLMNAAQKTAQKEWISKCFRTHGARLPQSQPAPQATKEPSGRGGGSKEGSSTYSVFKKRRTA